MKRKLIGHFQKVAMIECVFVVILSAAVIVGWFHKMEWLTKGITQSAPMNPVTGLCCILAVVALFCLQLTSKVFHYFGLILALIITAIGVSRFLHFSLGWHFDIGHLLLSLTSITDQEFVKTDRIAPSTAAGVTLVGFSLLLYRTHTFKQLHLSDLFSLITALVSYSTLIGYLYEGMSLYTIPGEMAMSLPGSVILFLLSTAILLSRSLFGILHLIAGDHPGSRMARQLIPFALILPVATGLLRTYNDFLNILPESIITAIILMANIIVMVGLVWSAAKSLNISALKLAQEKHQTDMLRQRIRDEETRQLKNSLMKAKIMQQKAVILATIEGQEKEKKKLGMELHDHINQILASTKLYLELANSDSDPSLKKQLIGKSSEQISYVIQEIRNLSHSLVMHETGKDSIVEDIAGLIIKLNETSNIEVHTDFSACALKKLDLQAQVGVYRILQEQLQNIVKHSGATEIHLKLWQQNDQINIVVRDNGKGFDPHLKPSGIGIKNIESRVAAMDGQINIKTDIGKGYEINITVPILAPVNVTY